MAELNIDWDLVINNGPYFKVPSEIPPHLEPHQYMELANSYIEKHLPEHAGKCLDQAVAGDEKLSPKAEFIRRTQLPVKTPSNEAIELNLLARTQLFDYQKSKSHKEEVNPAAIKGKQNAETCVNKFPDFEYGLLTLAEYRSSMQKRGANLYLYKKVLEINPYNRKAINALYPEYRFSYRLKEARQLVDKILELDPNDFDAEGQLHDLFRANHEPLWIKLMPHPIWGIPSRIFSFLMLCLYVLALYIPNPKRIKSGFIDKEGNVYLKNTNVVVQSDFSQGVYCMRTHGNAYFVDKFGTQIGSQTFDWGESFSEDMAAVLEKDNWGFIDLTGNVAITPSFKDVGFFKDGLAPAQRHSDELWGFIDKTGQWIFEPKYENVLSFTEGRAAVSLNGKIGFIDKSGNLVIPPQFDEADTFSEGLALVFQYDENDRMRHIDKYIDTNGDTIFELEEAINKFAPESVKQYYGKRQPTSMRDISEYLYAGKGESRHTYPSVLHGTGGLWEKLHRLRDGRIMFCLNGMYGYLDRNGNLAIPAIFTCAHPFSEGLALVSTSKMPRHYNSAEWKNVRYGFIDTSGEFVIPQKFNYGSSFHDGLARMNVVGDSIYIDRTGEVVLKPKIKENYGDFHEGLAPFECADVDL